MSSNLISRVARFSSHLKRYYIQVTAGLILLAAWLLISSQSHLTGREFFLNSRGLLVNYIRAERDLQGKQSSETPFSHSHRLGSN